MAKSIADVLNDLHINKLGDLTTENIKLLYDTVKSNKKKINLKKNKVPNGQIDKNSDKYKIALKFVNKILKNLKMNQIDDLTQFKNIDREYIISDINKKTLTDMEKEIYKYFDKRTCGWYNRKYIENYILTFMRKICSELGYEFKWKQKNIQRKSINKTHVFYSIKL